MPGIATNNSIYIYVHTNVNVTNICPVRLTVEKITCLEIEITVTWSVTPLHSVPGEGKYYFRPYLVFQLKMH